MNFKINSIHLILWIIILGISSCAEQFREIHGSEHAGNAFVVGNWGQAQIVNARVIRKNKEVIVHNQKELLDTDCVQTLLNESGESNRLSLMDDQKTLNCAKKTLL
jgi:hypothetical protein